MKLRKNEYCPIHRSLFCCGREQSQKQRKLRLGVQRIEDPHHPRGYRDLRSPAEMRKLLNRRSLRRAGSVQSAIKGSRIAGTSCPTTGTQKEWEELGVMTIRTTYKQLTGGAIRKRDRMDG